MTRPIKVLFMWHHHQPYYKTDGTFLMPWVRMHGIKDYWDMVRMLDDYPTIKQTFNFAPSLLLQIQDYLDGTATDRAYLLSEKDPISFSQEDKVSALKTFFMSNTERMVRRYPRYSELLSKRGEIRSDADIHTAAGRFSVVDFRDLQVWWNLAWVGEYSRFDPPFREYLTRERNFSEEDKHRLLSAQRKILSKIIPHHVKALRRKQIEISVSPYFHPILPLLCDTSIAVSANPGTVLPEARFRYAGDADRQIKSALEYAKTVFGLRPSGMWPSEGSVSDAAMKLFARNRVSWVATDETILHKSLVKSGRQPAANFLEKYFPYAYTGGSRRVNIFFRDHNLSDKIGFVYSNWRPDDAAHDFVASLIRIRTAISDAFGEVALEDAVVPVVLDGENAWEFYQSDGKDFLRTLYYVISNEERVATVLPSEIRPKKGNSLRHIEPGSWINGNFNIWIGHPEDNRAWDYLTAARKAFEKHSSNLSSKKKSLAYRELEICEGSDWCWWYGDEHKSSQAVEFDSLFRYHLKEVYSTLGIKPPGELDEPIKRRVEHLTYRQPSGPISPRVSGKFLSGDWKNAGMAEQAQPSGAMQKSGMQIRRVSFGNDNTHIYVKLESTTPLAGSRVLLDFHSPVRMTIEIGKGLTIGRDVSGNESELGVSYKLDDCLLVEISCGAFSTDEAAFSVAIFEGNNELDSLPRQGLLKFKLVQ